MYNFDVSENLEKILIKLSKKDKALYNQILKKIDEVIHSEDVDHYKNLRYNMKNSKLKTISTQISSRFLKLYNSIFKNWDNDVSIFESFKEEADNIIAPKEKSTLVEMEDFLQNQKKKRLDRKKD